MGTRPQHAPAYRRLCRRLREQRVAAGLTVRALAEELTKVHSYVAKVEHGSRRIDPIELIAWCKACGTDASELVRELSRNH